MDNRSNNEFECRLPIYILGGMGPQASIYLYSRLINLAIKGYQAKDNDDFPEIILHSIPVPDFISNKVNEAKALRLLAERVKVANTYKAGYISIACNTAHTLLPKLQKLTRIRFISMVDEVVARVKQEKSVKVGLLASPTTLRSGLYQKALQKNGVLAVLPTRPQSKSLERVIRNVIAGKVTEVDKKRLVRMADSLKLQGVEGIILGCTELPLIFPHHYSLPVFNSVEILAQALLDKYYTAKGVKNMITGTESGERRPSNGIFQDD